VRGDARGEDLGEEADCLLELVVLRGGREAA
jgi:hypothetical protein